MTAEATGWGVMEFEGMDLGDERRNRRAVKVTREARGQTGGEHSSGLRWLERDGAV